MPTNFPTSVDNFTNPTANDSLNLPSHSTQHANANDAIEAVESYVLQGLNVAEFLHVRDEKAQNTAGGTFTSGAWRTRDLNTVKTNTITGASLATNQITLPAGTYWIESVAPAHSYNGNEISNHQTRWRNITAGTTELTGRNAVAYANVTTVDAQTDSTLKGSFTITGSTVYELQHICTATSPTDGFGNAGNFGTEVYSEIVIWKVG